MVAYVIYNQIEVSDQDAIDDYRATIRPIMDKYGAKVLAVGTDANTFEGEWSGHRTMIIEFPDMEAVERWHTAEDYKPFLEKRLAGALANDIDFLSLQFHGFRSSLSRFFLPVRITSEPNGYQSIHAAGP